MASKGRTRIVEGFEALDNYGTSPAFFSFFVRTLSDGTARTGRCYARISKALGTSFVNSSFLFPSVEKGISAYLGGNLSNGDWVLGHLRCYFRIVSVTGTGPILLGGVGYTLLQFDARGLEIDPATMKWRINDFGTSAYSDEALPLNEWIEFTLTLRGRHNDGPVTLTVTCNGETRSTVQTPLALSNVRVGVIGDFSGLTAAFEIDVDDLVVISEAVDSADGDYPTIDFPTATHVKLVKVAYAGQTTVWADGKPIYNVRRTANGGPATETAVQGAAQPIYLDGLDVIEAEGLAALQLAAWTFQTGGMSASVEAWGETVLWTTGSAYAKDYRVFTGLTDADLLQPMVWTTSLSGSSFRISSLYAQGLFETDLHPPPATVSETDYGDYWQGGLSTVRAPFLAAVGTYTGSGVPQKISLPACPKAIFIRESENPYYNRCTLAVELIGGGHAGYSFGGSDQPYDAVQDILNNGFIVGYHDTTMAGANREGCTYLYIALYDDEGGAGGQLLQTGTLFPDALQGTEATAIPIPLNFEAGLILVAAQDGGLSTVWASPWDHSLTVDYPTQVSGYITNVSPTGFVFNEASSSFFSGRRFSFAAFSKDLFAKFFEAGEYVGTGAQQVVPTEMADKALLVVQSPPHSSTADTSYWAQGFPQGTYRGWTNGGSPAVDLTRLVAVEDAAFTIGTALSVLGRTYDWLTLSGYQQEQASVGDFPATRTLIASPTRGTVLSDGAAATLATGSLFNPTAYPLANLTDGYGRTVCRLATPYGRIVLDLGAAYIPDVLAVVNHNLDPGLVLGVKASNLPDLSNPTLIAGLAATDDPVIWIDLRGFAFAASRYWAIEVLSSAPNRVGLTFGEILVATVEAFEGILDPDHAAVVQTFRERAFTEYGLPYAISSGARQRALRLGLTLFTDEMETLKDIFDDAGTSGKRVLVIPDSRVHEAYFVEGVSQFDRTREDAWVEKGSLDLLEESFGVLHKGL